MRLIDADALLLQKFKNPISYAAFCNLVKRQMTVTPEALAEAYKRGWNDGRRKLAEDASRILRGET